MCKPETQCRRTCRQLFPYDPEMWCEGCTAIEAEEREENMIRWQIADRQREAIQRWEAKFAAREAAE